MNKNTFIQYIILYLLFSIPSLVQAASDVVPQMEYQSKSFIKNWLLCGPFTVQSATGITTGDSHEIPTPEDQKFAFAFDFLSEQGGESGIQPTENMKFQWKNEEYTWTLYNSVKTKIDFTAIYGAVDYAVVYAYSEIVKATEEEVFLALGSDDAIKVWLNGKLIHEKWMPRALRIDDDLVDATLKEGTNRLLVKVQDIDVDWELVCRLSILAMFRISIYSPAP